MPNERKRKILNTLGRVCRQVEELLAGQDVTLADLPPPQPGETDLERLQRFKGVLNDALAELNRGEPRLCRACAQPVPAGELDEMPWASVCRGCV